MMILRNKIVPLIKQMFFGFTYSSIKVGVPQFVFMANIGDPQQQQKNIFQLNMSRESKTLKNMP
jgi:hypothetical protein